MSVRVLGMVFAAGPTDLAQHSVMMALADNADDFGRCYPGQALLAQKSRMSERNVRRVLDALECEGWLVRKARTHGEHRRGTVYEMNLKRLGRHSDADAAAEVARDTESGRTVRRAENAATSARRADTASGTPEAVHGDRTPERRDRTMATPRPDMALADLLLHQADALQNRQEPSMEPSFPLSPPEGGIACGLDASREGDGLTEEQRLELAEVNAIRAGLGRPQPPLTAREFLECERKRVGGPVRGTAPPGSGRWRERRWRGSRVR